jgi:hypothetical protein
MSTITPSRLNDVSNAALFRELTADNFTLLAEEITVPVLRFQEAHLRCEGEGPSTLPV